MNSNEALNKALEGHDVKMIMLCYHGSHLYGTNTEHSDIDIKGIFIPKIEDVLLGTAPKQISYSTGKEHERNQAGDIDIKLFSLAEFIRLASQGETIAIDMLHADSHSGAILYSTPTWNTIRENRSLFYTKDMEKFIGYCRRQSAKYGQKGSRMNALKELLEATVHFHKPRMARLVDIVKYLPSNKYCRRVDNFYEVLGKKYQNSISYEEFYDLIKTKYETYGQRAELTAKNEGIDFKAISHAFRACYQLISIYKYNDIWYPLKEAQFLKHVKLGHYEYPKLSPMLDDLMAEVLELSKESDYPEKVDMKFWNNFLLKVYKVEWII